MKSFFSQLVITIILIFSFSNFVFAQKVEDIQTEEIREAKINSIGGVDDTQAAGDKIQFKDGTSVLMEIKSTGSGFGGQIFMPSIQSANNPKVLYNFNGDLYWGIDKIAISGTASSDNDWTISGNNIYNSNSGNVGIGINNPLTKLSVGGTVQAVGNTFGGIFDGNIEGGIGIQVSGDIAGDFNGAGVGVEASGDIAGDFIGSGLGVQASGPTAGDFTGVSVGVKASGATAGDFTGVGGGVQASGDIWGGYFVGNVPGSIGVQASGDIAGDFNGAGVGVESSGDIAGNFTGSALGVQVSGPTAGEFTGVGVGVQASGATAGDFTGVGVGVQASGNTFGGKFVGNVPGSIGVQASGDIAGVFYGDVEIDGNLIVSGSYPAAAVAGKIDHPLDPTNKTLTHPYIASSEMKNIYDGNITTDANGNANVYLPEWFDAVNSDFRYQLTVIGEFAQAIVSEKIRDNQFSINTNKPNIEVSWQVTGIRHDAYAVRNPIKVEEIKEQKDRGKYLYPKAYNQPETMGVNYNKTNTTKR